MLFKYHLPSHSILGWLKIKLAPINFTHPPDSLLSFRTHSHCLLLSHAALLLSISSSRRRYDLPPLRCLTFLSEFKTMAAERQKLRGFLSARVVAMRHMPNYDPNNPPRPNVGDIIYLDREPLNPTDPNSLLVKHNSRYIGYIAAEFAAELAPYIDNDTISVRGIVTAYRFSPSEKSFPCQILVFSATRSFPLNFKLRNTTRREGFQLNLGEDRNYNLRKFDEWAVTSGRGGTQGMNGNQQDDDVPPPVQVPPPTPVQVHQSTPSPTPPPVQVRQPTPTPSPPPVQAQQPSPTGGRQEETAASTVGALRNVLNHCSTPNDETVEETNIIKTMVNLGFSFGRAHFWPPDVTDLGT